MRILADATCVLRPYLRLGLWTRSGLIVDVTKRDPTAAPFSAAAAAFRSASACRCDCSVSVATEAARSRPIAISRTWSWSQASSVRLLWFRALYSATMMARRRSRSALRSIVWFAIVHPFVDRPVYPQAATARAGLLAAIAAQ